MSFSSYKKRKDLNLGLTQNKKACIEFYFTKTLFLSEDKKEITCLTNSKMTIATYFFIDLKIKLS